VKDGALTACGEHLRVFGNSQKDSEIHWGFRGNPLEADLDSNSFSEIGHFWI
jgi:hypothetical protein